MPGMMNPSLSGQIIHPCDLSERKIKNERSHGKVVTKIIQDMLERILLVTNFSRNRERCRKLSL